jgi:glycosyltransferase involved in cell wall biosynthesis
MLGERVYKSDAPKVSVLMSVYNGGSFLKAAIESILNQSYQDYEFLIVDDASTDGSLDIIRSFEDDRIVVIENSQNCGLIYSLNIGLKIAKGTYIARQDADDISYPERLAKVVEYLDANADVGLVGTSIRLIDSSGSKITNWSNPKSAYANIWLLFFNTCVFHPTSIFDRALALSVGGYSSEYKYAEDYKLWSDIAKSKAINNLDQILLDYRVHNDAVSSLNNKEQSDVRYRISSENIKNFLGEVLDSESAINEFQVLSKVLNTPSYKQSKQYILTLKRFYDIFSATYDLQPADRIYIFEFLSEQFTNHGSQLNFVQKTKLMIHLKNILPLEAVSVGLLIRFFVPEKIKNMLRSALRKPTDKIVR